MLNIVGDNYCATTIFIIFNVVNAIRHGFTKAKAYGLRAKGQLLKGMQWHALMHDSIITFMQKSCVALEILDEVKANFGLKI